MYLHSGQKFVQQRVGYHTFIESLLNKQNMGHNQLSCFHKTIRFKSKYNVGLQKAFVLSKIIYLHNEKSW